jgi:hypothetical protein
MLKSDPLHVTAAAAAAAATAGPAASHLHPDSQAQGLPAEA